MESQSVSSDGMTLLLISVLCAALAMLLRRRFGPAPKLSTALLCFGLVLTVGAATIIPFVLRSGPGALGSAPLSTKLLLGVGFFLPSLWIAIPMAARSIAMRLDEFLHRVNAELRRPIDYGKARAKERGGDVEGAVKEYRQYFDENPTIPEPLFSAAQFLTHRRRYDEAVALLKEVRTRFASDIAIWSEATYRLANLMESDVRDKPAAATLFRELIRKAGKTDQARLAAERLFHGFSHPPPGGNDV